MNPYPRDEELERIKAWDFHDLPGLFDFIKSLWWIPEWGWRQEGQSYRLSTGGWSGNEDLIDALQQNVMAWEICWQESRRGGGFTFTVPEWSKAKATEEEATQGEKA